MNSNLNVFALYHCYDWAAPWSKVVMRNHLAVYEGWSRRRITLPAPRISSSHLHKYQVEAGPGAPDRVKSVLHPRATEMDIALLQLQSVPGPQRWI